ncbi:MAG: hypothetical protein HZA08_10075 [Nitrospirae bacterium]|nr:hypothetical protein [Nitrospirota bacterium]
MKCHERGFTKGNENQRDKNVPPILKQCVDRRGFLTPPERMLILFPPLQGEV